MHCNSTVDVAPWRHEVPEVLIECAPGFRRVSMLFSYFKCKWFILYYIEILEKSFNIPFQPLTRFKRPPGWSPLRTVREPATKDSSEESKENISTTPHTPLNCPTKPWKEFKPIFDSTAPVNTTAPTQTNETVSDGAFSDQDLLS